MERTHKRGRVWWGRYYEGGKRIYRSTGKRDRNAAEAVVRQWERDAEDPDHAAARTATLTGALQLLLKLDEEEVVAGRRSADTVDLHRKKAGHLVRVFETNERGEHVSFLLARLKPYDVDGYVSRRRAEGAADATIAKELAVLRKSLRLAIRAGMWRGRLEEVIPGAFSRGYKPRKRALTSEEVSEVLAEPAARRTHVHGGTRGVTHPSAPAVLAKATLRAAALLAMEDADLARVIGLSPATLRRSKRLDPGSKHGELAVLFLRMYRSLGGLMGGDDAAARAWFHAPNRHLHGVPAKLVQTIETLVGTTAYLETLAHRSAG